MAQCLCCKGKGTQTCTVHEQGKEPAVFTMPCGWCDGTGEMTEKQEATYRGCLNVWCKCGNPSGRTHYHHPANSTEWVECLDCGKALQIG